MIQYDTLYKMLVEETERFIIGSWDSGESNSVDFEELMSDISRCFYDESGNYSSASAIVRNTIKSIENTKNPFPEKILMLRNSIISVLFAEKYASFKNPGEMYFAFEKYKVEIDLNAAILLKEHLELTDQELASLQNAGLDSPYMNKLDALLLTKNSFYAGECIRYLRMIKS